MSSEQNKRLVRRLIDEAVGKRKLDVLDELAAGELAQVAKRRVRPFQSAFPDFEIETVQLIADDEKCRRSLPVLGHAPRGVAWRPGHGPPV